MTTRRFQKGEFAFTTGSLAPSANNGHLVIIREVCGPLPGRGLDFAYRIERVDGEPFALVCQPGSPMPMRGGPQAIAGQHHLRPLGGTPRWKARRARARRTLQAA